MKNLFRHGDLIFKPLAKKPKSVKELDITNNQFVLALGEVTGHKHVMTEEKKGDMRIFQNNEGLYILEVLKPTQLSHEEHDTLVFEPGLYIMENEREHDYFTEETRQVLD